jgi:hypothetical protein
MPGSNASAACWQPCATSSSPWRGAHSSATSAPTCAQPKSRSHLDWTILRPPRLTGKPAAATYRTTIDRNLPRGYTISRVDLAACVLTLLDDPVTVHRHVSIAN